MARIYSRNGENFEYLQSQETLIPRLNHLQGGAPKVAKLVYNFNNYGL